MVNAVYYEGVSHFISEMIHGIGAACKSAALFVPWLICYTIN